MPPHLKYILKHQVTFSLVREIWKEPTETRFPSAQGRVEVPPNGNHQAARDADLGALNPVRHGRDGCGAGRPRPKPRAGGDRSRSPVGAAGKGSCRIPRLGMALTAANSGSSLINQGLCRRREPNLVAG